MPDSGAAGLLERERELEVAAAALRAAAEGDGRSLIMLGPAGIGKTRLLDELRRGARESEMRVLTARGSQLETGFPFGVARQLFEPLIASASPAESEQLLDGAAGLARPLLGLSGEPGGGEGDFAALHGLHWLVANLAEAGPVAVLVDDAHWSDPDSLRFLAYLGSRLEGLPVLLAMTMRPAEPGSDHEVLDAMLELPAAEVVEPLPLSQSGVAELAGQRFEGPVDPEFARACHEACGGNPFYCEELLAAVAADGLRPDASAAASVGAIGPDTVGRAVLSRLSRLSEPCGELARALSVLGGRAELRRAAALAELDEAEAAECADALAGVQILRDERPLDFAHPIVRTAVYRSMGPLQRASMHSRAARALVEGGAGSEEIAVHLLEIEPSGDARVTQVLRESAVAASERGALHIAATHLERALAEPPARDQIPEIQLELGLARLRTGIPDAPAALRRAVALAPPGSRRLELGLRAARPLGRASQAEAVAVCRLALEGEHDPTDETFQRTVAELILPASLFADTTTLAWEQLERHRDTPAEGSGPEALMLINRAWELTVRGEEPSEPRGLVEQALRSGALAADTDSLLVSMSAAILMLSEGMELATQLCDLGIEQARARGWPSPLAYAQWLRSNLQFRRGDLDEAGADAAASVAFTSENDADVALPWSVAILSDVLVERGQLDEADAAHRLCGPAVELPDFTWALLLESRGRLRLAQGRAEEAVEDLRESGRRWDSIEMANLGIAKWRADAAPALARIGRGDEARALAGEQLQAARRAGAGQPLAMALRAAAVVDEDAPAIELLREGRELMASSEARLERAHIEVELGAALRRSGAHDEAREALNAGLAAARGCGATPLAARAFEELEATGARPRKLLEGGAEALTPSERRVARMAADGLSNKQIAQTLFVTVRTVETHLRHTYQKLDIGSREEIAGALRPADEAATAA